MTAPAPRRPSAPAVAALAAALAVGCATLGGSSSSGDGASGGSGAPAADTGPAPTAAADSVAPAGAGDSTRLRKATADSAYRALLDSARALAGLGGEPAATPRADSAAGGDGDAGGTDDGYPAGPVTVTDVEKLRELGPVYTPYEIGPDLATREERLDGLLKATLVPVILRYELAPDEWARYWVLVDREGTVRETVLQLPSGHTAFDSAARAVAENLQFVPAERDGEAVPVWILARISLLMR